MKKLMAALLCAATAAALMACGSSGSGSSSETASSTDAASSESTTTAASEAATEASSDADTAAAAEYPVDKITLICPSDAGGAMDQNCRFIAPYLEKYVGVPVDVTNMGGSACWVGWSYLINQAPKDGSYISYANFPNMITGYLDPSNTTGLNNKNFDFLEMFTSDTNVIVAASGESRFTDLKSMLEYAKNNTLTIADAGARTDDAVCVAQLEKASGVQFQHVHFENTAGGMAAIEGKQVDLLVCNVSEVTENISSGTVTGIGVISKNKSDILPDLQCAGDLGYDIDCSSSRGVICASDMDESAKSALETALSNMMKDSELKDAAAKAGINLAPMDEKEFSNWVVEQNDAISAIYDMLDQ